MQFSKLYIIAVIAGIGGAIGGAFAGGFIAASRCHGGLECLGTAILGVGLGAILVESFAMSLSAHIANQSRGNLALTFFATLLLAVPIPFVLLPGFTAVLALPVFLFQTWVCVKVQLATVGSKKRGRRA
ncbi:MAG: hypothetical protein HQ475_02040 [SAR202 cluster bacterium]|nr:hypothetical protein [SAR202 cluster bacterium]